MCYFNFLIAPYLLIIAHHKHFVKFSGFMQLLPVPPTATLPALLLILYVPKVGDYRDIVGVGRIMILLKLISIGMEALTVSPKPTPLRK